jgi:hypothetical protein
MVAGGTAGALATSVSYPLDLLRTRLASYTGPIVGALEREILTGPFDVCTLCPKPRKHVTSKGPDAPWMVANAERGHDVSSSRSGTL